MPGNANSLFVTDACFGAAVLTVDRQGQATVAGKQAIDPQKATCWVAVSDATKSAYVTDVATNRVVEMSLKDASIIGQLDLSANSDPGLIDLKSAGNFVYALSPGNVTTQAAITVLDVSSGQGSMKQAQHFDISGVAQNTAQGMAVLL
jgi:DNA-binding beta-propeller fold protein YncE